MFSTLLNLISRELDCLNLSAMFKKYDLDAVIKKKLKNLSLSYGD